MTSINLYVLIFVSLSFSATQGRHNYFEHYFSKYAHQSSSTTPSLSSTSEIPTSQVILSSTQEIPTSQVILSSTQEIPTSHVILSSTQDDNESLFTDDSTVLHSGGRDGDPAQYMFVARVATIVGSLIFIVIVLGCIVCCCPKCCRGTERRGFIVRDRGTEVPPQPVIIATPQQPTVVQHIPPEYPNEPVQQFPPQYQPPVLPPTQYAPVQQQGYQYSPAQQQPAYSPVQQQVHYSPIHPGYQNPSTLQFYNPPEAPPPYEPTAPK